MNDKTIKNDMLQGQIIKGMNTQEASVTGGDYFFRVNADKHIWAENVDPHIVIKAQVEHPDDSKIWMTFKNNIQYPSLGTQTFQVSFEQGRVKEIENITGEAL